MLSSLFGDLGADKSRRSATEGAVASAGEPAESFAATPILQSTATEVNERGQMVDRHQHDLVVSGSPAQAIREHFASTRSDLETASRLITLLDPVGVWAGAVVKALSDAGGQPIERLHLRDQATLRTLATIERTTLVRRHEDTLKIYHADVRAPGPENAEIPVALMERSQMSTVIIGPMQPHAIDALLAALHDATALATWRCPHLVFMLPPGAVWIGNKIGSIGWPSLLRVHLISEPLTSASSVWNAMLGMWNQVKSQPGWDADELAAGGDGPHTTPAGLGADIVPDAATAPIRTPLRSGPMRLDPQRARQALAEMLAVDGLIGCAVVDGGSGLVLAREQRDAGATDLDLAAAASAQVLRAHQRAARSMGLPEHVDEVMTSAGSRQQVLRTVARHPDLFLLALLDKNRANLALARFKLQDVEQGL